MSPRMKFATAVLATALLAVTGCGNDNEVPTGGSVLINPTTLTWNVAADPATAVCNTSGSDYDQLETYVITVLDSKGNPLGKTELRVTLTFAGNNANFPLMWLMDDLNGDGSVTNTDGTIQTDEIVNAIDDPSVYVVDTDENGSKTLFIWLSLSCPYGGFLQVYSGAAFMNSAIDVEFQAP